MKKITLGISGMTCSACSNGLEKHLSKQDGIISVSVNLVMANATVCYDENLISLKNIELFIKQKYLQNKKSVARLLFYIF